MNPCSPVPIFSLSGQHSQQEPRATAVHEPALTGREVRCPSPMCKVEARLLSWQPLRLRRPGFDTHLVWAGFALSAADGDSFSGAGLRRDQCKSQAIV